MLGGQSLASQLDARGTTLPPRAGWCLWGRYESRLKLVPRRQSPLRSFFSVFIKVAASENEEFSVHPSKFPGTAAHLLRKDPKCRGKSTREKKHQHPLLSVRCGPADA